jgi:hypothetical protein
MQSTLSLLRSVLLIQSVAAMAPRVKRWIYGTAGTNSTTSRGADN